MPGGEGVLKSLRLGAHRVDRFRRRREAAGEHEVVGVDLGQGAARGGRLSAAEVADLDEGQRSRRPGHRHQGVDRSGWGVGEERAVALSRLRLLGSMCSWASAGAGMVAKASICGPRSRSGWISSAPVRSSPR